MTAEESFEKFFNSFPRYGTRLATDWKEEIIKIAENYAIEFAKFHVEAALKEASEKASLTDFAHEFLQEGADDAIDKESILNAYPLENIK